MYMEPIVHKLKRILRDKGISHATIAELTSKHRTYITRKLNGDSMETRLLEQILQATGISYQDLVCGPQQSDEFRHELQALRKEMDAIKEEMAEYRTYTQQNR